jgi:hypothetical protein
MCSVSSVLLGTENLILCVANYWGQVTMVFAGAAILNVANVLDILIPDWIRSRIDLIQVESRNHGDV